MSNADATAGKVTVKVRVGSQTDQASSVAVRRSFFFFLDWNTGKTATQWMHGVEGRTQGEGGEGGRFGVGALLG